MAKISDLAKWRAEIQQAEQFREDEFGVLENENKELAGENLDYYENGFSGSILSVNNDMITTLNIVDAIVSIIVPSLYFRNPKTIATPEKVESEDVAPLVGKLIDYYRKKCEVEVTNQRIIFDAYLFGYGVYKVGYATKFGMDIRDEEKEKERSKRTIVDRGLEAIGLKKREKEEVVRPEMDLRIVAEAPFIEYISPFNFGIDPRATTINDAQYVYHKLKKTVKSLKENPKYKNTKDITGDKPEVITLDFSNVSESEQEEFHTRDLFEIHYRNEDKMYMLVVSRLADGSDYKEHYHEESIYDLGEWQFDTLSFKKHNHTLYPKSDITKIKNLQDRITTTIDSILEQVDKFVPKLAYQVSDLTPQGKTALKHGGIGALVECSKNPNEVFKELNFTQLKADLAALIDQLIGLITVQTGLTRAQLMGVSDAKTATEAQLEQGGANIRLSDMSGAVTRFVNSQSRKLWKIIRQFTPLEELQLINGVKGTDPVTGTPKYNWLTINSSQSDRIQEGDFDFSIEVGSTEKVNLAMVRKAFENMFNILARTEVITLMQAQGDSVQLAEILKKYIDLFPEIGMDAAKIIQKVQPTSLPQMEGRGGTTQGSNNNALERQLAESAPTQPQMQSEGYQV